MYRLKHHKTLKPEKWFAYSMGQQIMMTANEMNRAQNWIAKQAGREADLCYERAFELIDLTIEDPKWKGRLRELLRFREVVGELYTAEKKNGDVNRLAMDCLIKLNAEAYNMLH